MGAGLLPRRVTGRREIAMLAAYGVFAAYAFGLLMNLSGWPFLARHRGRRATRARCRTSPGRRCSENLHRFLVYTLLTSTGSLDTGRAITNAVLHRRARPGHADHAAPGGPAGHGHATVGQPPGSTTRIRSSLGGGRAAAVAVGGGHPQVAVGGDDHGAQPAVLADEEVGRAVGALAASTSIRHSRSPRSAASHRCAVEVGQPGRRGLVGVPHDLRVDVAPARRRGPRPSASRSCRPSRSG